MGSRLLATVCGALVCGALLVAGCGPATPGGKPTSADRAAAPASPGAEGPAAGGAATPGGNCRGAPVPGPAAGALTGVQFVSASTGWVVGQDEILATTDGGRHWTVQDRGRLDLTSVDFISGRAGWAVGTGALLATTDGGAHWTALPEPCPVIRSVHFISPDVGFAVAGGSRAGGPGVPVTGGIVLATDDGGRSWGVWPTPRDAQSICYTDPVHGWLGAGGLLYRTIGGRRWVRVPTEDQHGPAGQPATMIVQCAGSSAWAVDIGPGAAASQEPHVGYHASPLGAKPIFAELYFTQGAGKLGPSPGAYPGPVSAISPSAAVFIDWCPACGPGTAPWDLATRSGASLTREGDVGGLTEAAAASFLSTRLGWVVGSVTSLRGGRPAQRQRIVFTGDGGRTWHVQYTRAAG